MASNVLNSEIGRYMKSGFTVAYRDGHVAQLMKKKQFSLLWFFLGLGLFYLPFYVAKRDKMATLELGEDGKLTHKGAGAESSWALEKMRRHSS